MQWDQSPNLGFSAADASQLYLPVDSASDAPTVDAQLRGSNTLLAQVKDLVRLRRDNPALGSDGIFAPLYAEAHQYPFVYSREKDGQTFVIAVNPSGTSTTADFAWPNRGNLTLVRGDKLAITLSNDRCRLEMPPLSYGIFAVVAP
jgi:glycosidase